MIPPNEWPIGCQYATVTTVTHKPPSGMPDPFIMDRICLPNEAAAMIAKTMEKNPYATAYVSGVKTWLGGFQ